MTAIRYSVAIRTLGKGGEKYKRELESIQQQTIPPEKVIVYIAQGYALPDFRIGIEEYVYVPKGMVSQRAIDYREIDTPLVLLLDDDVWLPANGVETLIREMQSNAADVIAADVFKPQNNNWKGIIRDYLSSMFYPHVSKKWAFKVLRNASCSYNKYPKKRAYYSQTAAGPASLWKKSTLLGIHYKDELWLDQLGFAWGDDQIMFYKVFCNGYKLMVSYDSDIEHLDAKSASTVFNKSSERLYKRAMAQYLVWYRSCYQLSTNTSFEKVLCRMSFFFKELEGTLTHLVFSLVRRQPAAIYSYFKGLYDGKKTAHLVLDKLPNYILIK
jgi:GT2 family glycosyltransferase